MARQTENHKGETAYDEREAVAIFGDEASLNAAVDALIQAGWEAEDMSLLGHSDKVRKLQARAAELADKANVARTAYVSPDSSAEGAISAVAGPALLAGLGATAIVTSGGLALLPTIAVTAGSASIAGGIGLLFARAFGRKHADHVQDQILNGGLLLWVKAREAATDDKLLAALRDNGGRNVHMHVATRSWGVDDVPFHNAQPDPLLR
ncbi:MAG: hypothetical protein JNK47_21985 [Mesorhizobium sp.]|nr:hypothetical protein [Mesorhizobium sp.]MBL8579884.1 hypothetical protein [Mesorhizobium sp.]